MKKLFIILLLFFSLQSAAAMNLFVDPGDPVYDFLERQAVRGICRDFLNDTRPLIREEIAKQLLIVNGYRNELSKTDVKILEYHLSEYRREMSDDLHPSLKDGSESYFGLSSPKNLWKDLGHVLMNKPVLEKRHIYILENDKNTIWADADIMIRAEGRDTALRFVDHVGGEVSVQAGDHLAFFADVYLFHQYLPEGFSDPAPEFRGYWYNDQEYENLATFDRSEAYANVSGDFGTLTIAHYPVVWGNSMNSMILSGASAAFGSLQWTKEFRHFKYTFLHGSLMADTYTLNEDGRYYVPKYMAAHRLETRIGSRLHFNFSEIVIYGNRIPEVSYLVPVNLLWPTEHALGDRDNKMIAFEGEYYPVKGVKLYGSVFLDEFSPSRLFKDWWANKFGVQAGIRLAPLSFPADIILEATAVHPWTYTHKYSFGSLTHHGYDLGFKYGPNTQLISGKINYDLSAKNRISFIYHHLLEGADMIEVDGIEYPSGGNSNQNYENMAPQLEFATKWLMGDITRTDRLELVWRHRFRNQIFFNFKTAAEKINEKINLYYGLQMNISY